MCVLMCLHMNMCMHMSMYMYVYNICMCGGPLCEEIVRDQKPKPEPEVK